MREAGVVPESWMRLLHRLMETAHRLGRLTDAELAEAESESVAFWNGTDRPPPRPPVHAQHPIDNASGGDVPVDSVPDSSEDGP